MATLTSAPSRVVYLHEQRPNGRWCWCATCPCGWWSGWSIRSGYVYSSAGQHTLICPDPRSGGGRRKPCPTCGRRVCRMPNGKIVFHNLPGGQTHEFDPRLSSYVGCPASYTRGEAAADGRDRMMPEHYEEIVGDCPHIVRADGPQGTASTVEREPETVGT